MKTLYFDCGMGAAGDMLMAALLQLHSAPDDFLLRLNGAGIPGVTVGYALSVKCGIKGLHINVTVNGREEGSDDHHDERSHEHEHDNGHHHHHHDGDHSHGHSHGGEHGPHHHEDRSHEHGSYHRIEHLIDSLNVSGAVKKNVQAVYKIIASAESHVHGVPVAQIHFHEVGDMDALADITGVCMLMEELGPDLVLASPVNTGSGFVRCAHGLLPVPAPATAYILQNVPMYNDGTKGELCTPTGAALLKHFAGDFCQMPVITVSAIGYGMGKKNFEKANCVRAFWGETAKRQESMIELVCNIDDMPAEAVSFAQQLLLDEGALDVYTVPAAMKKGRSGLCFFCMCKEADKDKMLFLLFKHTSTLGIREYSSRRHTLQRKSETVQTKFGSVRVKTSFGFGVEKSKAEYEDVAQAARKNNLSIREVLDALE